MHFFSSWLDMHSSDSRVDSLCSSGLVKDCNVDVMGTQQSELLHISLQLTLSLISNFNNFIMNVCLEVFAIIISTSLLVLPLDLRAYYICAYWRCGMKYDVVFPLLWSSRKREVELTITFYPTQRINRELRQKLACAHTISSQSHILWAVLTL